MRSISFPDMFSKTYTNVKSNSYDCTLQNMRMLLYSEKGELFGDPYYGVSLKKYLFDQNDKILRDILIDDIYTAIKLFIPQVDIERKWIKINKNGNGKLVATIKAINKEDFTTNLYNIVLLDTEA